MTATLALGAAYAWASAGHWTPPAHVIAAELAEDDAVPVLVPVELPDGYVFHGPGRRVVGDDGRTALASWTYGPRTGRTDVPMVELCVSRRGHGLEDSCHAEGLQVLTRSQGQDLHAAVTPLSGDVDETVQRMWDEVELTDDLDRAAWTERRPVFE